MIDHNRHIMSQCSRYVSDLRTDLPHCDENEEDEVLEDGVYFVRLSPEPAATEGLALAR